MREFKRQWDKRFYRPLRITIKHERISTNACTTAISITECCRSYARQQNISLRYFDLYQNGFVCAFRLAVVGWFLFHHGWSARYIWCAELSVDYPSPSMKSMKPLTMLRRRPQALNNVQAVSTASIPPRTGKSINPAIKCPIKSNNLVKYTYFYFFIHSIFISFGLSSIISN